MRCKECYSEFPRITPLKGAEDCLKRHRQYVCSTSLLSGYKSKRVN